MEPVSTNIKIDPILKQQSQILFEKIEDEYDIAIANEAYDDYVKNGKKSHPISKLWKEVNLT